MPSRPLPETCYRPAVFPGSGTHSSGTITCTGIQRAGCERKREEKRLRRPQPLSRVFVIDVSAGSVARGVVREVCEGIRKALYGEKKEKRREDGGDCRRRRSGRKGSAEEKKSRS